MTIQDLGSIGEFTAAVATVATLAYLAVQIRQSNTAARAQSRQTLIDTWASRNWDLARDPRMLRAFAAGVTRWPDISNEDKTVFDLAMGTYLANIQNGLLLRDAGLLDESVLDQTANYMVMSAFSPGGSRWWSETGMASPEVRTYIEQRLANRDVSMISIDEMMPYWMAMASDRQ